MAAHLNPASLLLTLFLTLVVTVYLARAAASDSDVLSDVEVNKKCGFTLSGIHDCKYNRCQEASAVCAAKPTPAQGFDLTDCQIEYCMDGKKACEEPLNKYLSEEEVCEGDAFNEVEKECLRTSRKSTTELTACKRDGYLEKKVICFKAEWKRRIGTYAKEVMKKTASQKAIDCAYEICFQNVTTCLYDDHHELATNPASKRKFDLEHCAYVAVDYAHECESVYKLSGCAAKLKDCINSTGGDNNGGIVGGVIGGVCGAVLVAGVVKVILDYRKKRNGTTNTPSTPLATSLQAMNPQDTNVPDTNVQETEDSQLLDDPAA